MNKKILIVSILAVFTLVAISFATAVSSNTVKSIDKKESPLYGIRTRRAIGQRLGKIIDFIKTKFIGDRIFFLPFNWLIKPKSNYKGDTCGWGVTCDYTGCEECTSSGTCDS